MYVKRRGYKAFDTAHLKEGAWHYSLDGFIYFFIEALDGSTFIETPSGRGRMDIIIIRGKEKYVIEIKIFRSQAQYQKGKKQLVDYLKSEGLTHGYYVVFSKNHKDSPEEELYEEESIEGKTLYCYIISVEFDRPSDK